MNYQELLAVQARRRFLQSVGGGIGAMALGDLMAADSLDPLAPREPHFPGKAKSVIFMFMEGGPSQYDLFDPKPELQKWHGKPLPESLTKQMQLAFIKPNAAVLASPRIFTKHGQSGTEFSDWIPQTASCADDICLVRSMHTDAFNHHPGQLLMFSGSTQIGRPTLGAWSVYGLGSQSKNLPGFVVLSSGAGTSGGATNFSSGFLPSTYQGTPLRSTGDPILYLSNPPGVSAEMQRGDLDAMRDLNQQRLTATGDAEIASRMSNYELAYRMQSSAPEMSDLTQETKETLDLYGVGQAPTDQFARNCLMARRMVQRGVRFILITHASWDDHTKLNINLKKNCDITDRPTAALLKDLKRNGLLDSTMVVWGGEFGRTPMQEVRNTRDPDGAGRDHHPMAFSMWLAGGGIKGGQVVGRTDDIGFNIVENPVHVHDLQATMLHTMGFDHTRLTYRHMGRDFRLTDVEGKVVKQMLT